MMAPFAEQLRAWGPASVAPRPALAEAERFCRELATSHYENFPVVSLLLPRPLRQHFCNIYAYCRWSDDLADEALPEPDAAPRGQSTGAGGPNAARCGHTAGQIVSTRLELLAWWRNELTACFAGEARHPVYVALQPTIQAFRIPIDPFADLLSAFVQDQTATEYATFAALQDYCRRSADPVGRLVLYLCERAVAENFAWSDSICTGLQLANFWQDVARDLGLGRIYLPQDEISRFGCSKEQLARRETTPEFVSLMRFQVTRAAEFLQPFPAGQPHPLNAFPFRAGTAIRLFALGGLKILEKIERQGFRVLDRRPKLSKFDMASVTLRGLAAAVWRR